MECFCGVLILRLVLGISNQYLIIVIYVVCMREMIGSNDIMSNKIPVVMISDENF